MTLRIAGAASAPMPVLMRVRRSRRRSLIRYLLMAAPVAAPGDRVSGSPEGQEEVYHIPPPCDVEKQGAAPHPTPFKSPISSRGRFDPGTSESQASWLPSRP